MVAALANQALVATTRLRTPRFIHSCICCSAGRPAAWAFTKMTKRS